MVALIADLPCPSPRRLRVLLVVLDPMTLYVYGVRSLCAVLTAHGFEVRILFLQSNLFSLTSRTAWHDFDTLCANFEIIGFSFLSPCFALARHLTTHLRQVMPEKIIVFGGHDATLEPDRSLEVADAVCIGEGEISFTNWLLAMEAGGGLHGAPGMAIRQDHERRAPTLPPLIRDFSNLPTVDNHFSRHYLTHGNHIYSLGEESVRRRRLGNSYMTMTSFGCTMRCTYCVNNRMFALHSDWGKVRRRPVEHVIRELQDALMKIPRIWSVDIVDDDFGSAPVEYLENFRDQYRQHIHLPLDIMGLRPTDITREKLNLLRDMGAVKVRMGIQTVSPEVKKLFRRTFTNEYLMEKVHLIHQYRKFFHAIRYDFIVDTPWDPPHATQRTLEFIADMPRPFFVNVYKLAFYPGTELYQRALDERILDPSDVWEGRLNENFMALKPSWENFLLVLMGLIPLSRKAIRWLLHPALKDRLRLVPQPLFRLVTFLSLLKRFMVFVWHGDFAQIRKLTIYFDEYRFLFHSGKAGTPFAKTPLPTTKDQAEKLQ